MDLLEKIDIYVGGEVNEESGYQKFFKGKLQKAGFDSVADMSDQEKKDFFNMVDKEWKGEKE